MAKVIGLVQSKGGVGRSTIATNIAGILSKTSPVALIDADAPQFTSASWAAVRKASDRLGQLTPTTVHTHHELIRRVEEHVESAAYIIVDCPPRVAETTRAVLVLADLLLVPLGASTAEIWATSDLLSTLDEAKEKRAGLTVRLVWNRFRRQTKAAQELPDAVRQEIKVPAVKTRLGYRVAYSSALARGLTVQELSDPVARTETERLVQEVKRLLA